MKNFRNYFMLLAVFGLLFTSCSKDENNAIDQESATLTFGTALKDFNNANKQVGECVDGEPAFAQITLIYGDMDTEVAVIVPILEDDNGYFTAYDESLEIPVATGETHVSVTLTDFVVWADNDNDDSPDTVLWVAPKVGSEYQNFVTTPLGEGSSTWALRAGSKTYYDVEVLCFDNRDVNRYGYQFFDITPVELQNICFFANYCTDDGRHYTANYTLDLYTFTGTPSEDQPQSLAGYTNLYTNIGLDGDDMGMDDGVYYADPLCVSIPNLDEGEYIYYEATVENWNGNYPAPGNYVVWGYISQDDIDALVAADGDNNPDTMDYVHLFFNCQEGDSVTPPNGDDCVDEPDAGCDQIVVVDETVSLSGLGVDELPTIVLFLDDSAIGFVEFDFNEGDLTAQFDLNEGYVITDAEIILDALAGTPLTTPVPLCIQNISENAYLLTWELGDVPADQIFPIIVDLTMNVCTVD
jgi:hypothetical protein